MRLRGYGAGEGREDTMRVVCRRSGWRNRERCHSRAKREPVDRHRVCLLIVSCRSAGGVPVTRSHPRESVALEAGCSDVYRRIDRARGCLSHRAGARIPLDAPRRMHFWVVNCRLWTWLGADTLPVMVGRACSPRKWQRGPSPGTRCRRSCRRCGRLTR
jgi:hypothetical protein